MSRNATTEEEQAMTTCVVQRKFGEVEPSSFPDNANRHTYRQAQSQTDRLIYT